MKIKIVKVIMLSIIILCMCSVNSFAQYVKDGGTAGKEKTTDFSQQINPEDWNPDTYQKKSAELNDTVGRILGLIRNVGIIISVLALMIIGSRTMYGSLEDKSHYKELLPTFLIGVFILLSCTTIPDILYRAFK